MGKLSTEGSLTSAHYEAIGKIAAEWSYVEHELQMCIWRLADIPSAHKGYSVTANLGSVTVIDMIKTLAGFRFAKEDSALAEIKTAFDALAKLRTKRNAIVHGLWYPSGYGAEIGERMKIMAKGKFSVQREKYTALEMEAVAHEIAEFLTALKRTAVFRVPWLDISAPRRR